MSTYGSIERRHRRLMNKIAKALEATFEGCGFALLIFDFNTDDGRVNYISNARREDMITAMKEFIARNEGMDVDMPRTKH